MLNKKLDFNNKTVLITGGASGFGFELVKLFLFDGANVIFTTRKQKSAEDAISKIPVSKQNNISYYIVDLKEKPEIESFILNLDKDFPNGIDVLINNAVSIVVGKFEKLGYDDLLSTLNVNLVSPYLLSNFVLKKMKQKQNGVIVNILSNVANIGLPYLTLYSIGKSSLRSMSDCMSIECKQDNISVISVYPGPMDTGYEKNQKLIDLDESPYEHRKKISSEIAANNIFQKIKNGNMMIESSSKSKLFQILQLLSFNYAFKLKTKYLKKI